MNLPNFPDIDLFSAGINALNGVLVARNPSHDRGYAVVGLLIMAFFGGIGGGITRDVLLNEVPSPLKDARFFFVCMLMGIMGLVIYRYAESREERFRTRLLAFFKSFTLPWFAILGAHKAINVGLGFYAALLVGLAATTAGGVFIDVVSGVTPEILKPSEHVVTTAIIASSVYTLLAMHERDSQTFFPVTLVSVIVAFTFRVIAVKEHWAQIVPISAPAAGPVTRG